MIRKLLAPARQDSKPDSTVVPGSDGWSQPRESEPRPFESPTPSSGLKLPRSVNVPMQQTPLPERSTVTAQGNLLTLVVRDGSLGAILNSIAEKMGLNVVSAGDISGNVSITLKDVPLNDALDAILSVNGYRWVIQNNIIMVSSLTTDAKSSWNTRTSRPCTLGDSFASVVRLDTMMMLF